MCSQSDEINLCKIFTAEAPEKSQEMLDSDILPKMLDSVKMGLLIEIGIPSKASLGSNSDDLFQLNPQEFV